MRYLLHCGTVSSRVLHREYRERVFLLRSHPILRTAATRCNAPFSTRTHITQPTNWRSSYSCPLTFINPNCFSLSHWQIRFCTRATKQKARQPNNCEQTTDCCCCYCCHQKLYLMNGISTVFELEPILGSLKLIENCADARQIHRSLLFSSHH